MAEQARDRRPTKTEQRKLGRVLHRACLAWCRERYDSGHPDAVLHAVDISLRAGMLPPLWARQEFCDRFLDWAAVRRRTLDDAFGALPLAPREFATRRRHDRLRVAIVYRVLQLHAIEGLPLAEATFARVGRELNASTGTVRRIYYEKASETLQKVLAMAIR